MKKIHLIKWNQGSSSQGDSASSSIRFPIFLQLLNCSSLQWIFHDWQDEECVKILCQCKKAIPSRDAGGKVIIIDTVVGFGSHVSVSEENMVPVKILCLVR
jgi:hypothetical protein